MYLVDHVEVVRVASLQGDWQDDFPFAVGDTRSMWNGIVEVQERQWETRVSWALLRLEIVKESDAVMFDEPIYLICIYIYIIRYI